MSSLKDKNFIVTGASGGIGNSIAEKLNEQGANVLATGTRIGLIIAILMEAIIALSVVLWGDV